MNIPQHPFCDSTGIGKTPITNEVSVVVTRYGNATPTALS
jgi:hypothetical protein